MSHPTGQEATFAEILSEYEHAHATGRDAGEGREATVVAISGDSVYLDIGLKIEAVMPLAEFKNAVERGAKLRVEIRGRDSEGYYRVSQIRLNRPRDWHALEKAFAEKRVIAGVVSGLVKGGLSVDIGVPAFMPASRSGARDAAEMENLVGQEITCRVIKLDTAHEDVVVDRRVVLDEEEARAKEKRFAELEPGAIVRGTVRSLTEYGAFIDVGGIDGLLHVGEMSWGRIAKPADVLAVGDSVEVQVLKIDFSRRRVSLGMKQLQPDPWTLAGEKYKTGDRVRGVVSRITDFGAFVELEPGVEGLIHLSEMSWSKKTRKPSDVVKQGDSVEVVVLGVNLAERRISLGLKQALGDPWDNIEQKFPVGSVIEGPITSLVKFGAFMQLTEGVEGLIHIADISAEKRINHPQAVLKPGQAVRAAVLELDKQKRRIRLGLKQLAPTTMDEYIAEHKLGDVVSGRVAAIASREATVELGEGILGSCRLGGQESLEAETNGLEAKPDLSSLTSMLSAKWKHGASGGAFPAKREPARAGQIRSFRIVRLDAAGKRIEVELAS